MRAHVNVSPPTSFVQSPSGSHAVSSVSGAEKQQSIVSFFATIAPYQKRLKDVCCPAKSNVIVVTAFCFFYICIYITNLYCFVTADKACLHS